MLDLSGSPNLEKLSAAYDFDYLRLETMENAESIINSFLNCENSVLLECLVDPMDLVK